MPDANNFNDLLVLTETVDHAIRGDDDFPNIWVVLLRNLATDFREIMEFVQLLHQSISKVFGAIGTVGGNRAHEIVQVVERNRRPDYLASHEASCRLTSSCGIPWPWSS